MRAYGHQRISHEVFCFFSGSHESFTIVTNDYVLYYGISGLNLLIWLVELENGARLLSRFVIHTLG